MTLWLWISLALIIVVLVCLDLALITRRPRVISPLEAGATVGLWLLVAVVAAFGIGWVYQRDWQFLESLVSDPIDNKNIDGHAAWLQFLTCYVIELALSLDNIVVLVVLYAFYRVPREIVARALFWSVLIALVGRLLMIVGGAALLRYLPQLKWVFGAILVVSVIRIIVLPDERTRFDQAWYVRLLRRLLPVSDGYHEHKMLVRVEAPEPGAKARWMITPLMLVVIIGGLLDIAFTADSVPALFSVTKDPFLAFAASSLAILSLRSIFLTVRSVVARLRYLKHALAIILIYVAAKTFLADYHADFGNDPTLATLIVVLGTMAIGIGLSVKRHRSLLMAQDETLRDTFAPTPLSDFAGEQVAMIARRNFRKVAILIGGTVVVLVGILIAPLPGPGPTVLVPIGLAILATEFVWARWLLEKMKSGAFNASDRGDAIVDRFGVWLIPVIAVGFWVLGLGIVYGGVALINVLWPMLRPASHWTLGQPTWYTILVIVGSPFMPVMLWMLNYLRKYSKSRRAKRMS